MRSLASLALASVILTATGGRAEEGPSLQNQVSAHIMAGEYEQAEKLVKSALEKCPSATEPNVCRIKNLRMLSSIQIRSGRQYDAEANLGQVLMLQKGHPVYGKPEYLAEVFESLSFIHAGDEDPVMALSFIEEAVKLREESGTLDTPQGQDTKQKLVTLQAEHKRKVHAEAIPNQGPCAKPSPDIVMEAMSGLQIKVRKQWKPGRTVRVFQAVYEFDLHRDGSVSNVHTVQSSGDTAQDQLAIQTIEKSAPYKVPNFCGEPLMGRIMLSNRSR